MQNKLNWTIISSMVLGFIVGVLVGYAAWGMPKEAEAGYRGSPPSASHSTEVCGEITMSFDNPTPWLFVFDYRVDGEAAVSQSPWAGTPFNSSSPLYPGSFGDRWHLVPVDGARNQDIVLNFGEDTGVHQVEYRLAEGAEQDMYFNWTSVRVQSDCEEPQPTTRMCHWLGDGYEAIAVTEGARTRHFNAHKEDKDWEEGMDALCEFEPEPTPPPTPTPTPEPEKGFSEPGPASAPDTCPNVTKPQPPANFHLYRLGGQAELKWMPTDGETVNIYYRENSSPDWQHSVINSPNDGVEMVNELGGLDWTFGLAQVNSGCNQSDIVSVVDGLTNFWVLFR